MGWERFLGGHSIGVSGEVRVELYDCIEPCFPLLLLRVAITGIGIGVHGEGWKDLYDI
jgi:hypothetical protein